MEIQTDVVHFELNNWMCGEDYPNDQPFISWLGNDFNINLRSSEWAKTNHLCVVASILDMSSNFCITASRKWVEEVCPKLLTHYPQFLRTPDEYGELYGRYGCPFLEYTEANFGVVWWDEETGFFINEDAE